LGLGEKQFSEKRAFLGVTVAIKALLLDIGGVLMRIDPFLPFQKMNIPLTYQEALQRVIHWPVFLAFESGNISTNDFLEEFNRYFQVNLKKDEFLSAWKLCLQGVLPGMEEIVLAAAQRVRLFTLSNTNVAHYEYFAQLGLFRHFEQILTSFGLHARKPDPLIYQRAIAAINLPPGEMLFIDDMEDNVAAARKQGLHAQQSINDPSMVRQILRNYQITPN
jgi:glucose-1-phosphatase